MKEVLVDLLGKPEGIVLFQLIMAARFTVLLSAMAFIGGGIVGAIICTARVSPVSWISRIGSAYVWFFQSTPLLMLLFLIGLGLPKFTGWDVDPWTAAGLSLTLYASAYLAEVWRGAIATIGLGQWEAGRALGLTFLRTLQLIIFPQALRGALAPTVGFLVQSSKARHWPTSSGSTT